MTTYRDQLKADMARIEKEVEGDEITAAFTRKAGAYDACAYYYASSADYEAAKAQRLGRDPKALIAGFTSQIGGPSAADLGVLLRELHQYLRLRPELEDAMFTVEQAAHACEYKARQEQERAEKAEEAELARLNADRENLIERGIATC